MSIEIERKFLVRGEAWRPMTRATPYRQGYLGNPGKGTVRVRIAGDRGYLAVKGITAGLTRQEYEYEIPLADAETMLADLCEKPLIEKNRYRVPVGSHVWEIDEFFGENRGLLVAEVELQSQSEPFERPAWIGEEVSDDPRYFNANLVAKPFTKW
jgi:CYTH domain-containing protein